MNDSVYGAVYGALVADAFALGAHWLYDTDEIKAKFPDYKQFYDPVSQYHGEKKAGDLSHYGDQTMWLLESIALEKEFSLASFAQRWKAYMSEYKGYIDGASKTSLENLKAGRSPFESGSLSQDLSVVGRIAPLVLLYHDDLKSLENSALLQAKMTHNSQGVKDAVGFFSHLLYLVLEGYSPIKAVEKILDETQNLTVQNWIKTALASREHDTLEAIDACGKSCNVKGACPGALHLIVKYEDNYVEVMQQNVYAGGDSCARGMVTGMILGAYNGLGSIPAEWVSALDVKEHIASYLEIYSEKG
jgi:ADP-ribosylglycohydrolase